MLIWLVVEPYPSEKYENQLGLLFLIYGKLGRLVVELPTPLKNDGVKVNCDHDIPKIYGKS